jgi:DNA-binding transcriptional LysR family regulator
MALRFFEETARHLSFSSAASALCVTQGAVSRQIRILEESLGTDLFERDHKGIHLTVAGLQLLPFISEAFDTIERGSLQINVPTRRQRLILSVPPTFGSQWFSPRLSSLAAQLPDVELSIRTEPTDDCHFNIRFGREALATGHSELLMTERHTLVGAPQFLGLSLDLLLARIPALHVLHNDKRLDLWPTWLAAANQLTQYAQNGIEFSSLEQAIHAARKAAGLAIVDRNMIVEELSNGNLAQISEFEVIGPFGYWLDISNKHANLKSVQAFANWLRNELVVLG